MLEWGTPNSRDAESNLYLGRFSVVGIRVERINRINRRDKSRENYPK